MPGSGKQQQEQAASSSNGCAAFQGAASSGFALKEWEGTANLGLQHSMKHFETFANKDSEKYGSNSTPEGWWLLVQCFDGRQV